MNILDRIKSESTEIGKWFQYKIPVILILIGAIHAGISQLDSDTAQLIPVWFKQLMGMLVLLSSVIGTLTVKKDGKVDNKNTDNTDTSSTNN